MKKLLLFIFLLLVIWSTYYATRDDKAVISDNGQTNIEKVSVKTWPDCVGCKL